MPGPDAATRALAFALSLAALTACGPGAAPEAPPVSRAGSSARATAVNPAVAPAPPSPRDAVEAPVVTGPGRGAEGGEPILQERNCLFVVDGLTRVEGRCLVYPMGDGGSTLNVWSRGKPARPHFAVVSVDDRKTGQASWNADPDDSHAWDPLGVVSRSGDCWVNARTRICVR